MRRHSNDSHPRSNPSVFDTEARACRALGLRGTLTGASSVPAELNSLAEHSQNVLWLADGPSHSLLYVNRRFESLWGIAVEALLEDPCLWNGAVVEADAGLLPVPFFEEAAWFGGAIREYRIRGADGQLRWIRDRRFELKSDHGHGVRVGGIAEDITEWKEREAVCDVLLQREHEARIRADELASSMDEFLAVVTHELRTPLNAIRGWAHVLRQSGPLNPLQVKALDAMERNTLAQSLIVNDLLDSQSVMCGDLELSLHRLPLASLLAEAVESVQPAARAKNIRLELLHDPRIGQVLVDANRLRQALLAILSNAVKFTQNDGSICVSSAAGEGSFTIEIHDTGIGLDAAQLPALFERFTQANRSRTRREGGLGLGLFLACQLVELHGGRLRARSAGLGQGAIFTLELPVSHCDVPEREPVQRAKAVDVHKPLAGRSIVLVDDDDDARGTLEFILRNAGADVRSFNRTVSAFEHLAEVPTHRRPDMLISDIAMPDEDGYAFIQRVRILELEQGLPRSLAVASTAFGRPGDKRRALAAGFDAHIGKPLDAGNVVQTLCGMVGRPG
jgi:signal transduction histidine kinase/ActR/RegA family two-component response regulator